MILLSYPFLFAVMGTGKLDIARAYFGAILGLLLVVAAVCMATVSECDKMSINSLYWDVDAPIAHPFCDHF